MILNPYKVSNWLRIIVICSSLLVIIGWVFDVEALTRFSQNQNTIKFITAVVFAITAISMVYISQILKNKKDYAQVVLPATSMIILLVMFTLLAAGIFGVETGIENFFIETKPSVQGSGSGMPAVPTMVNFVLIGLISVSALFVSPKRIRQLLTTSGYLIFGSGFLALTGYILGLPFLYWDFNNKFVPVALYTSILFILLGIDMLLTARIKIKKP